MYYNCTSTVLSEIRKQRKQDDCTLLYINYYLVFTPGILYIVQSTMNQFRKLPPPCYSAPIGQL
jgi:hypothetical protein